jgi:ABC-type branched-subunit amino acid transport system substrate-binding protein
MHSSERHFAFPVSSLFPFLLSSLLALGLGMPVASAEPGVTDDKILFGQSAAFGGPASALGTGMHQGLMAAFGEANAKGGVHGRSLEIITRDDGYEPDRAIANVKRLIDEDQVFSLIGAVGTPTSKAAQPIAAEAGVPFIGPFTGAGFLRDPEKANVINVRATYDQETETWIKYLHDGLGKSRIATLYQDDGFGRVGLSGVTKALEKRGLKLVAEGKYKRNTTAVKSALLTIRKADPEAIVMVGAYQPLAEFVKLARKLSMGPTFVTISFVGSKALSKELGDLGEGVVISQVVPLPEDTSIKLVADYRAALKAYDPALEPGFVSLEGYMAGKLTVAVLEKVGRELSREAFLDAVYGSGAFDLGGATLTYGPGDNQGMDEVFLTVIEAGGRFKSIPALTN